MLIIFGTIEVQGNPTQWTNNDVTLSVNASNGVTILSEYSFDGGTNWTTSNSKLYNENIDNIEILAKDQYGQILRPQNISITKIDKTPPEINFEKSTEYNSDGTTKQVDTLIVVLGDKTSVFTDTTATDEKSGVSQEGIKCYRNGEEITTTDFFTQVGRYRVVYKIQDKAGNETEEERQILVRWPTAGKYVVKSQNVIATGPSSQISGAGLYEDNATTGMDLSIPFSSKYYYSGATVNNYINFAGKQFRIMNVPVNDGLKLVGELSSKTVKWGSLLSSGTYKIYNSDLYTTWQNTWWQNKKLYNSNDTQYTTFTEEEWSHIENATFYVGRFKSTNAQTFANIVELERTSALNLGGNESPSFQGYSAFPNVSDYIRACNMLDQIQTIEDTKNNKKAFKNNSWLGTNYEQWTMNSESNTNNDNDFWTLDTEETLLTTSKEENNIEARSFDLYRNYRPVFYLKNDTILSGTGTLGDPFTVQENWSWFDPEQIVQ